MVPVLNTANIRTGLRRLSTWEKRSLALVDMCITGLPVSEG
ncbi:hypothetical protein ECP030230812_5176 [Escherichia coli P0302308.12]|nr:hypothetical protein ECP030230812_5176 [Escherichia coli P0302308.12]